MFLFLIVRSPTETALTNGFQECLSPKTTKAKIYLNLNCCCVYALCPFDTKKYNNPCKMFCNVSLPGIKPKIHT